MTLDKKMLALVSALQQDVDMMLARPAPKDGRPGVEGQTGDIGVKGDTGTQGSRGETGARGDTGETGRDGRDGTSVSAEDVATLVQSRIRIPEDGNTGDMGAQGPQGPQGEIGPRGRGNKGDRGDKGDPGKDGSSITALDIKDNTLFAAIDGKRKKVGSLKFDMPATFDSGGGGGKGYNAKARLDALGWDAAYSPNKTVPALTSVYDEGWTMVSNKQTDERAAPQPVGPEGQLFNGVLAPENDTAKQIIFGVRLTVVEAAYALSYRVDTVVGNEYQVFLVQDSIGAAPVVSELGNFVANSTGWQEFNIGTLLLVPGITFDLVGIVDEPDPTPATFNGDWDYRKPGGGGGTTQPPNSGEIIHPNNASQIFRVSKTDDSGGDRSAELAALTIGDNIEGQGVRWAIQNITDDGTYFSYQVAPSVQAQDQGVFDFVFETVVATPITFGRDLNYWDDSSLPNIRGLLGVDVDYASVSVLPDAFGIDLRIQRASISADWDLMATSEAVGSGGPPTRVVHTTIGDFSDIATQAPTGTGLAGVITVSYGVGGVTDGGEYSVAANGEITTMPPAGGLENKFLIGLRIGRTGGAGVSVPLLRFLYADDGVVANAIQVGSTFAVEIDDADTTWREVFDIDFAPSVGSVFLVQMARNPGSNDSGGLQAPQPAGDLLDLPNPWNPVPVSRIVIQRLELV